VLRGGYEIQLTSPASNTWASLGKCHDSCVQQYAFAIVQGSTCWCSNYAPANTVATTDCNAPCPGYPYEFCGAEDSGLFGYLALNKPPSGTMGASSAPPPQSSAAAVSPRYFLRYGHVPGPHVACHSVPFIPDSIRSRPLLRPSPC
jgi:WSC domain